MRSYVIFAAWTLLAGAGIPLIGVLNSGIARSVGNPFAATTIMFAIAMAVALGLTLPLYGLPTAAQLGSAPTVSYAAGLLTSITLPDGQALTAVRLCSTAGRSSRSKNRKKPSWSGPICWM